jgi:hypothetical protein
VTIVYRRGSAGTEFIPSTLRPARTSPVDVPIPSDTPPTVGPVGSVGSGDSVGSVPDPDLPVVSSTVLSLMGFPLDPPTSPPWFGLSDFLSHDDAADDIPEVHFPVNSRFSLVGYTDASFAVGPNMESISGLVIYLNGTPIMWNSKRQTIVADSTCAAEFIAASECGNCMMSVENMLAFLGFKCPAPYKLYTDSQASLSIATNLFKMGKIRHIAIRYHLVRCMVARGLLDFVFCVTEDMIADLLTKVLCGAAFDRLSARFYYIGSFTL